MRGFLFLVLCGGLLAGCSKSTQQTPPEQKPPVEPPAIPAPPEVAAADQRQAAEGDTAFAVSLHKKVAETSGNFVYSPADPSK